MGKTTAKTWTSMRSVPRAEGARGEHDAWAARRDRQEGGGKNGGHRV